MTEASLTTRATQIWAVALTGASLFMITLDNLIVLSTLPSMQRDLGVSIDRLQWVVDAYILSFAVLMLTGAALGDRYGRRRMLVVGLLVFTASSAAGALSNDLTQLVAARAVQGVGAALLMPLTLTLLSAAFPPERRTAALGLWSSIAGLGVALGPVLGGVIVETLDWHWIFWINVPVGLTAAALAPRRLTESRGAQVRLDLPGLAYASGGLLGIVWATTRGNADGWSSPSTLLAYGVGAAAPGRVRRAGAALRSSHAAARPLPPARLRGLQRRGLRAALHDVRGLLPDHPVPDAGAGRLRDRRRRRDAALDAAAARRLAVHRRARRSHRQPAADRVRAAPARRPAPPAPPSRWASARATRSSSRRWWRSASGSRWCSRTSPRPRSDRRCPSTSARPPAPTARSGSWDRCSASPSPCSCSTAPAPTPRRRLSSTACALRSSSPRPSACSVRSPRSGFRPARVSAPPSARPVRAAHSR